MIPVTRSNEQSETLTIGGLIATLYPEYQKRYRDDEKAAVATAEVVNRILSQRSSREGIALA